MSVCILLLMMLYSFVKFEHLMSRHNPNLAQIDKPGAIDEAEVLNFREKGLNFAFHVEGMNPRETKIDPRYVKFIARLYGRKNGEKYEKVLSPHLCTSNDLPKFGKLSVQAQKTWDKIMKTENRSLFCLDWDKMGDEIELIGFSSSVEDYQMFTFDLVPCNYVHNYMGYEGDSIAEGCIADREA